ncbi:hypothetical protein J6590_105219, partial [Homalodisca vitripennis]
IVQIPITHQMPKTNFPDYKRPVYAIQLPAGRVQHRLSHSPDHPSRTFTLTDRDVRG